MKNKLLKNITVFIMIISMIAALAFTVSASETDTDTEVNTETETFTVNGVEIPKFDFITKPYLDIKDANIPLAKIREAFNILPEFKYENGKYMVSDIGADSVELYNNTDYEYIEMTLENGYWVVEISEEEINDPDLDWNVYFKSVENKWEFYYHDEEPDRRVQFCTEFNMYTVAVYIDTEEDWVDVTYPILDRTCQDSYRGGLLTEHKVMCMFEGQDDWFSVVYNPDKTVNHVVLWYTPDSTYYYLISEQGWYNISHADPDYKVNTPAGYEDKDIEYFVGFAPCIINCTHENLIPATCEEPSMCFACGTVSEGSVALGHDMVTDEAVDPTCTETGLTQGFHCSRCDSMTTPQIEIPALGHDMVIDEAVAPTCTETGLTEGEHCSRCDDATVEQAEVPALDHNYVDGVCDCGGTEEETTCITEESEYSENTESGENTENSESTKKTSGCGSSIGMGAIAIVCVFGAAIMFKKKS